MVVGVKSDKQKEQTQSFLGLFFVVLVADETKEERNGRHWGRKWEPRFWVFLLVGLEVVIVGVTAEAVIHQAITKMVTTMDTSMDITKVEVGIHFIRTCTIPQKLQPRW